MAIADLVMMEAVLEVVKAVMILAIIATNLQILDPLKEESLETEALNSMMMEANTVKKQNLAGEESQRSDREATVYNRFVNSTKYSGGSA
ncbi:isoform cra_a [Lynx pardinus]|uniref:Isoform cra_a n=1 Tax=Lynx pardinus TaxID=191816 RepID=A0A485NXJ4_LYNPA|nr:isoform cra_a [Lynx pardinus]